MRVCTIESTKIIAPTICREKTTFELVYANEEVKKVLQNKGKAIIYYLMKVDMMVEWEYRGQTKPPQERDGIPQHCANNLSCCVLLIWSDK
jgi:hypothetical protein